jgi:hypothetical protein
MSGLVVFTSIYGGYDPLRPHPDHPGVEAWLCFTDNPDLRCDGWETVVEAPRYEHPRLSAKWRKCHPPDAHRSLWVDGSLHLHDPVFVDVIDGLLDKADMAFFPHPVRTDIRSEADASHALCPEKYAGLDLHGQVAHYHRTRAVKPGLWASTTFGRNHTPAVLQMGAAWMAHCELLTYQDQLSLPVLIDDYGLTVAAIPGGLLGNPWFTWCGHDSKL